MIIALVGNQNCGKSSLFNALCSTKQIVGNWPGVTIEKKEGLLKNSDIKVVDLPGTYSLIPFTPEEEITSKYILNEKIDLIVNVIDTTNLERNLYLTTQLANTNIPVVIALNMSDLLIKRGISLDLNKFKEQLKCDTFLVSSKTNIGINDLLTYIKNGQFKKMKPLIKYDSYVEDKLKNNRIKDLNRLFESNELNDYCKAKFNEDFDEYIINLHYKQIDKITSLVLKLTNTKNINQKIDKYLLNKYLGIPIFLLIMSLIYFLSISIFGGHISDLLAMVLNTFNDAVTLLLSKLNASKWLISLIIEGILSGVSSVLQFLPSLFILFMLINFLENSGYMSRITLLLDRIFHKIGLSGKSLIPFIVGTGCSVPGILSARTIKDKSEREKTMSLTYLIPCSAKLPVIVLFSSAFFPKYQALIAIFLYFLSIFLVIVISAFLKIINKSKEKNNQLVFELPNYSIPNIKYVLNDTFIKIKDFIKRAGSIILLCSIIVWTLGHLSFESGFTNNLSDSILAQIGKAISCIFYPILKTNSWEASISFLQGIIAKEQVVASMEIIAKLGNTNSLFVKGPFSFFTSSTALAFCVFNLFSCPCISTVITLKNELRSTKKTMLIIFSQTLVAYLLATLIAWVF